MHPRTALAVSLDVLAAVASAAPAAPRTRTVATQVGTVRQLVQGDRYVAWTRCLSPKGPTEVWAARRTGGRPVRVRGIRAAGQCEQVRLIGAYRNQVVTLIRGKSGLQRLDAVNVRTGRRALLEAETEPASGFRIVDADTAGPRVVWIREIGAGDARVSETVVGDLRAPAVGTYAGAPRRVVYTRSMRWRAVEPRAVWIAPGGAVVVREQVSGAMYGYGTGADRLTQVLAGGRTRTVARTIDGLDIAGADVSARFVAYTVLHAASGRVWMYTLDRRTGRRRLVRRLRVPARVPGYAPAVPVGRLEGPRLIWRERLRVRSGYRDRVLVRNLRTGRVGLVARVDDSRGQRAFVGPPTLVSRRAAWAQLVLPTAEGPAGGYYGLSPAGAQARILTAIVR